MNVTAFDSTKNISVKCFPHVLAVSRDEAALLCTEVQINMLKSKHGAAGISFVNGGALNCVRCNSFGCSHRGGLSMSSLHRDGAQGGTSRS